MPKKISPKNKTNSKFLFGLAVIIASVLVINRNTFYAFLAQTTNIFSKKKTTLPAVKIVNSPEEKLIFLKENNLYSIDSNKNIQQLTHFTTASIVEYQYNIKRDVIVFTSGDRNVQNGQVIPNQVHLLNVKTLQDDLIFEYETKKTNDLFVSDRITKVKFSEDGNLVIILTSEQLLHFDLQIQKITNTFTSTDINTEAIVGDSYTAVTFSPDNESYFLENSAHEGASYDLITKNADKKKLFSHSTLHQEISVIGWVDSDNVLIAEFNDSETTQSAKQNKTLFYKYNINIQKIVDIFQLDGYLFQITKHANFIIFWYENQVYSYDLDKNLLTQLSNIPSNEITNGMIGTIDVTSEKGLVYFTRTTAKNIPGKEKEFTLYSAIPNVKHSEKEILSGVEEL